MIRSLTDIELSLQEDDAHPVGMRMATDEFARLPPPYKATRAVVFRVGGAAHPAALLIIRPIGTGDQYLAVLEHPLAEPLEILGIKNLGVDECPEGVTNATGVG